MKIGLNYKCTAICQVCDNADVEIAMCCHECKIKGICNNESECGRTLEECVVKEITGYICDIDFNNLRKYIK